MTSFDVTIERAAAEHASTLATIAQRAYQKYLARLGQAPEPMLVDYDHLVADGEVHIAVVAARIVGFVALVENSTDFVLDNIAVLPDWQGQGIGHALIEFAEEQGRLRGHDHIQLYTNAKMAENRALYARLGYRDVARRRKAGHLRIYMRKPLGARGGSGVNLTT